ncbi:hypothetical protein DSO57_1006126 [Entomophthora muscae]|uniref:Uncharacterized protein n=1 Tax=Entomophthora muscae TaxID=34485 RepID=A0ACC2UH64_9FUNG|nr:hypothetical protein DSO57_1006126 [Entomophthora muscae]
MGGDRLEGFGGPWRYLASMRAFHGRPYPDIKADGAGAKVGAHHVSSKLVRTLRRGETLSRGVKRRSTGESHTR